MTARPLILLCMAATSGMEIDQLPDVHREQEPGQVRRLREVVALQAAEVTARLLGVAGQGGRLSQQGEGGLQRLRVADLLRQRARRDALPPCAPTASGLQLREADIEAREH